MAKNLIASLIAIKTNRTKTVFVQSNFGIILSIKVKLFPTPEKFESFVLKIQDDCDLEKLVEKMQLLRAQGTLSSLVHIANATRSLITTDKCPVEFDDKIIDSKMAQKLLSTPLLKVGYWTAIGGLYGSHDEVKAKRKEVKRKVGNLGQILFLSDKKINFIRF